MEHNLKTLQKIYEGFADYTGAGHGDKGSVHTYIESYERLLTPYRNNSCNILEIGLAYGESLEMWHEFFDSKANIYGLDIHTKEIGPYLTDERFKINIMDATSPLIPQYYEGIKFDVIIEDGSHTFKDQIETFNLLKGNMNKGGIYIIEDVNCLDDKYADFLYLNGNSDNCEVIDNRKIKGRVDDVLIVYNF